MMNSVRPISWRMLAVLAALLISALAVTACAQPVLPAIPADTAAEATEEAVAEEAATEAAAEEADTEATVEATVETTGEATQESTEESEAEVAAAAAETAAANTGTEFTVSGEWDGIPVGFTAEGYAFRGEPDAPVTMVEFSDFECPFCARYFVQTEPAINDAYVRTGQLRVVFREFPIVELHPNAPAAHQASLCAAEQGAAEYWTMHSKLFQTQTEWSNSVDPLPVFARLAEEAGVDATSYASCMDNTDAQQAVIDVGLAAGQAAGVSGTPSFVMSGADGAPYLLVGAQPFEQFALYIDALLAGEQPPVAEEEAAAPNEIPFWATTAGWQPDPERPGFNMAGDQYRGDPNALVTVIEFSDFQCPYCQQHVVETQPALDEKYVDNGQIMWVFKHFPLDIHPQAPAAGAAAECAADQGMFWEMHAALFADQEVWSVTDPTPIFEGLAADVGLDADAFSTCMAAEEAAARVSSDMTEGAPFVQGTPTFIVLANGEGQIIPGALPLDTFVEVLDEVIAQAEPAAE